jgi:hypothetical protein
MRTMGFMVLWKYSVRSFLQKSGTILYFPFFVESFVIGFAIVERDFYFRALGSLVVLSFPELVSFSSVFPKPLSETLRRSSDGRIPV